jgi:hypothetical protein
MLCIDHAEYLAFKWLEKYFHQAKRALGLLSPCLCLIDIWRALIGCIHSLGSTLEEVVLEVVVILCGIDIFYMACMLRKMGPCHRAWSYLIEEC